MRRLLLLVALVALAVPTTARAAFPGTNGKIAFTRYTNGDFEIWSMNPDGSARTRLTNTPGTDTWAAWSPDGTKIAFASSRSGNNEIYVMNADGSNQVRLTVNPANDNLPAWSPDGTKIAFTSDRDVIDSLHNNEIYVMNADGTGQTRVTDTPPLDPQDPSFTGGPRWSPDGTKIAFTTNKDFNYEIYVMNANGTGQTRLTNLATDDESPDWSPDGSRLAFVSDREGGHQVWVMNADGSGQTRVTSDPNAALDPAWSPDGMKLALTNIDPCCSGTGAISQIYTINADGTDSTNLTNSLTQEELPAWQPIPPGPKRSDYKNSAQFCKADRNFLGDDAFNKKYASNGNGANAFGKCVSGS